MAIPASSGGDRQAGEAAKASHVPSAARPNWNEVDPGGRIDAAEELAQPVRKAA